MSILTDENNNAKIVRPGQFGTYSYKAQKYIRLNKSYVNLGYTKTVSGTTSTYWQYKYDTTSCDMVIIRCEIPEGASGYIMGFRGSSSSNEFSISIVNGVITYKIGSNTTTHAWEAGVHNIGFTSDYYAYFDGKTGSKLTPSAGANGPRGVMPIGGWYKNGSYESVTSIDIYDVVIDAFWVTSQRGTAHFYAASGIDNTTACIFQTRIDSRSAAVSNQSGGSSSVGGDVTYGVQLHDLKYMTSSGYRDLVALMCEDWPEQASADADPAYTLTNSSESKEFKSAFMLKGNDPNTHTSTNMPIPTGWSHESTSPSRPKTQATILGDLIYGRTPKWKLWAADINVGKRVKELNGQLQYVYNIFMPFNGQQKPNLEQFEGYSNAADKNNVPGFDLASGTYEIEYHNGVPCKCGTEQRIDLYNTGLTLRDDFMVFKHEMNAVSGKVKAKLGNLVNWHLTPAEIFNVEGENGIVTGMSCSIEHILYNQGEPYSVPVAQAYVQTSQAKGDVPSTISAELMPLSKSSDAATKNLFQKGKLSDGVTDAYMDASLTGRNETILYRELESSTGNIVNAKAQLAAINYTSTLQAPPTSAQIIRTEYVLPVAVAPIHGNLDTKVYYNNATNYRCVIMNGGIVPVGNTNYYVYPVETNQSNGVKTAWGVADSTPASNKGFALVFAFITTAWTSECQRVDATNLGTFYIAIETLSINSGTYTKGRYAAQLGLYQTSDSNPATGSLTAISETILPNGNRLLTLYQEQSDAQKYVMRYWFPKSEISAVFNGNTFIPNTTVKVWIKHSTDTKPLIKYNAEYHSTSDSWRVNYLSGSKVTYLFFDNSVSTELLSRTAMMKIVFSSWKLTNNVYTAEPINTTTDQKRLKVTVTDGWGDSANIICEAIFTGGPSSFTKQSGTSGWDFALSMGGDVSIDPNTGYVPQVAYSSYELTIIPTYGQSKQWTSPLLRVSITAIT